MPFPPCSIFSRTVAGVPATNFDLKTNFNSLQGTVRKQLSHGLTTQIAYTYDSCTNGVGRLCSVSSTDAESLA